MKPLLDEKYYQTLSELLKVTKDELIACTPTDTPAPEFGEAVHASEKPPIEQHLSCAALAACENQALDKMVSGCIRFQGQLPEQSLGKLLVELQPPFSRIVEALSKASPTDRTEADRVLSQITQAVYMIFFKVQKIDSYGVHHKGQTHAASVDAMVQALLDSLVVMPLSLSMHKFLRGALAG
tara:strand:- start:685 stop:1230 length:546 start_codon:yes stop_codon:yes gene_type:complete